jgi:hypothetical protein
MRHRTYICGDRNRLIVSERHLLLPRTHNANIYVNGLVDNITTYRAPLT